MEVTYRTNNAEGAIREIATEMPEMLVGAGTVIEPSQVESAVKAGAKFVVTPNLDVEVVKTCQRLNIPVLPGCATPTDIAAAMSLGLNVVKFFPAEASGGLSMIKAMNGPFGMMKFLPTGGINLDNMMDYLKNDKILAVGGTFMANEGFVRDGQFDRVEDDDPSGDVEDVRLLADAYRCQLRKRAGSAEMGRPYGIDVRF